MDEELKECEICYYYVFGENDEHCKKCVKSVNEKGVDGFDGFWKSVYSEN